MKFEIDTQNILSCEVTGLIKNLFCYLDRNRRNNLIAELQLVYGYGEKPNDYEQPTLLKEIESLEEKNKPDITPELEKTKRGRKAKEKNPDMVIKQSLTPTVNTLSDMSVLAKSLVNAIDEGLENIKVPEFTGSSLPLPPAKPFCRLDDTPSAEILGETLTFSMPLDFSEFISIVIEDIQLGKMNQHVMNTLIENSTDGILKNQRDLNRNQEWLPKVFENYKIYIEGLK